MVIPIDNGDATCVACGKEFRQFLGCVREMGEETRPLCLTCLAAGKNRWEYPPNSSGCFE